MEKRRTEFITLRVYIAKKTIGQELGIAENQGVPQCHRCHQFNNFMSTKKEDSDEVH